MPTVPVPENSYSDPSSQNVVTNVDTAHPNPFRPKRSGEKWSSRWSTTSYGETSDIPQDAAAIGWTMVNRVGDREFGATLTDVLRQRNGFQIVPEGGGPAGGTAQWRATEDPSKLTGANTASWAIAQQVAAGIIDGSIPDPTGGATFFFSADDFDGMPKNAPGGFERMLRTAAIQPSLYKSQSKQHRSNFFFIESKNKR